jgi:hypothetical protein
LRISVVLITPDHFGKVRRTCRYLAAQTICREMELVLCVPALGDLALEEGLVAGNSRSGYPFSNFM